MTAGDGSHGGDVSITGKEVTLRSGGVIDATGEFSGGDVYFGGGWQGGGDLRQATFATVESGAIIDVSALNTGDAGTIVVWSDVTDVESVTRAQGTLLARGGQEGGDGGRIETSGHFLEVAGVSGDASASDGLGGEWLFDPFDIVINDSGSDSGGSFTGGTWTCLLYTSPSPRD